MLDENGTAWETTTKLGFGCRRGDAFGRECAQRQWDQGLEHSWGGQEDGARGRKGESTELIDPILGSRWNLQRYLTRITPVLSADGRSGKVPFGQQSASDLRTALALSKRGPTIASKMRAGSWGGGRDVTHPGHANVCQRPPGNVHNAASVEGPSRL